MIKEIIKKGRNMSPVLETNLGSLIDGDCLDVMENIKDGSVDCFFADPPFNLRKKYGKGVDDSLGDNQYLAWCYKWIDEGVRVLKPGGSFFLYNLPKWNLQLGAYLSTQLTFKHWIAIDIKFSLPIPKRLYPSHYSLLYFVKGEKPNTFNPPRLPIEVCRHCGGEIKDYGGYKNKMNPKGVNLTDVWCDIPPVRHRKYKNREANELSLKLMDRILDIATKEGDTVLDPFGGSGTTFVAAELKRRKWLGIEISTCSDIIQRFSEIDPDRTYLEKLHKKINVLFTEDTLKLRKKNGKKTSMYNVSLNGQKAALKR